MSALGNLVVGIAMDTLEFSKGVDKTSYEAQKFAADLDRTMNRSIKTAADGFKNFAVNALATVGVVATVSAAMSKLNNTFQQFDKAAKDSQRFGIAVEELTALQFAANLSGASVDKLGDALKDMLKNASDAANGSQGPASLFRSLGVTVTDAGGKVRSTTELVSDLAEVFSGLDDGATKTNLAMKVFGESGKELIPMLNAGRDGIRQMTSEAESFGAVVTESAAMAAEKYNDNIMRLGASFNSLYNSAANSLLPSLNSVTTAMVEATAVTGSFGEGLQVLFNEFVNSGSPAQRIQDLNLELISARENLETYTGSVGRFFSEKQVTAVENQIRYNKQLLDRQIDELVKPPTTGAAADLAKQNQEREKKEREDRIRQILAEGEAAKALAEQQKKAAETRKQQAEADREYAALMRELGQQNKSYDDLVQYLDQHEEYLRAKDQETESLRRQLEEIGLSDRALASLRASRLRETAALKESTAAKELDSFAAEKLRKEAEELRKQADLGMRMFDAQAAQNTAKEFADEFDRVFDDMSRALTDALFAGGKSGGELLKNYFKTFAIKVFVEPEIKAALSGLLGVGSGSGGIAASLLGNVGSSFFQNSLLGGLSGAFGSAAGYAAAVPGLTSAAAGSQAALLAAQTGSFGAAGTAATAAAGGSAAAGFASTALAAAPYVAAALAVASIFKSKKISADLLGNANFGFDSSGRELSAVGNAGGFASDIVRDGARQIADSYVNTVQGLGGEAIKSFNVLFGANTGRQGADPQFGLGVELNGQRLFTQDETQANDANTQLATLRATFALLQQTDFADNIDAVVQGINFTDASFQQLSSTLQDAQALATVNTLFDDIEGSMGTLSGASIEVVSSFLNIVGGLDGLQAGFGSFYDVFSTEQDKAERMTRRVTDAFEGFGRAVPESREELVNLVEGLKLQDESQAKLLATIFQLTPALDQLLPAFDAVEQSAESVASAYARLSSVQMTNEQIAQQRIQLEQELFSITATAAQLSERQRNSIDESNRALYDQIQAVNAQRAAADEAARQADQFARDQEALQQRQLAALQAISNERSGLESRLLQLQGNTAELRARELAALDPANRALAEQIFALEDFNLAQETAVRVQEERNRALEQERQALERISGLGRSIADYVRNLGITESTLSPQQRLQASSSEFNRILSLAQGGDENALSSITGVSDSFLRAAREFYGSTSPFAQILNTVSTQLTALPAVQTYEQQSLDALNGITTAVDALNTSTQNSLGQLGSTLVATLTSGFDGLDLNVDGGISQAEFTAAFGSFGLGDKLNAIFSEIDVNGNGLIDRTEAVRAQAAFIGGNTANTLNSLDTSNNILDSISDSSGQTLGATNTLSSLTLAVVQGAAIQSNLLIALNNRVREVSSVLKDPSIALFDPLENIFTSNQALSLAESFAATALSAQGFSTGGYVSGPGTSTSDSIFARLSDGEFVIRESSTRAIGQDNLDFINRTGMLPRVGAQPSTTVVNFNGVVDELRESNRLLAAQLRMTQATALQATRDADALRLEVQDMSKRLATVEN